MANAIVQISRRAKQLQRSHKNWTWKQCIKHASAEYRSGKKTSRAPARKKSRRAPVRKKTRSAPAKKVRKIKRTKKRAHTGVRTVTGTSAYNHVILERLRSTNNALQSAQNALEQKKKMYKGIPKGFYKNVARNGIRAQKKLVSTLKKELSMIKALLK